MEKIQLKRASGKKFKITIKITPFYVDFVYKIIYKKLA